MNQYKDLVINESDGKKRYNIVKRDGTAVQTDVCLELCSPVLQEGDQVGAKEFNYLIARDNDDNLSPGFIKKYTATLTASGWTAGKTQDISIAGIKANSLIFFGFGDRAGETQKLQYSYAVIGAATQAGSVRFTYAGAKPTVNIPILVVDFGAVI